VNHPGWCLNLIKAAQIRAGEHVIVVVDGPLAEDGSELATAVTDAGARADLHLWAGERPIAHAPEAILEAARAADVSLHLQQNPVAEEAGARVELARAVTESRGRQIFMGEVDRELLRGELSQPGVDVSDKARELLRQLEGVKTVRVRGRAGTDLTMRVEGRLFQTDAAPLGPGDVANYPGGEVFVAPIEDSANGALVVDLTVPYTVEGLVDEPVRLTFEHGRVTGIEGRRAAEMLRDIVERAGKGGDVIAEFAVGFYPGLEPRGHVMLDEKAAGTAHVAIGNNTGFDGGVNMSSIHVDMIFSAPELEVDGRRIEIP
jgi:aminopeptidase